MMYFKIIILLTFSFILIGCSQSNQPTNSSTNFDITRQAQFHAARDAQRRTDLTSLANGLYQYAVDNNGQLPQPITKGGEPIDAGLITNYLVPQYVPSMPVDPLDGSETRTKYTIYQSDDQRIHLTAQSEQSPGQPITVVR